LGGNIDISPYLLHNLSINVRYLLGLSQKIRRTIMNKKQKTWMIAGISAVVVIAVVLIILSIRGQGSSSAAYQTTTVEVGTLTSTVEGSGTVESALSANLNWQASGQIDQVNSQIGDQVKAGDVLASLLLPSETQTALESSLVTAQENLAELTSPSAVASAQAAVAADEQALTNAQINVNNLGYHDQGAIDNAYAAMVLAQNNLAQAKDVYNNIFLPDTDSRKAQAYQTLYAAQVKYDNALHTYNAFSGHPTQATIDATNAALALAKANLAQDQAYLTALAGGDIPSDATGTALLKLKQARLAVQTAQENLDAPQITAPFDGTVTQADAVLNAVVSSGTSAFRVDDLSKLVVDVQVLEIDISSVKVGQSATVTFDAIPNKTYNAKVVKVDLAGTASQNSVNFIVTVQLSDADAMVKPGMSANVTIVTNEVQNALLVPSTAIFVDNNNQQFVYLVQGGAMTEVPVTVGAVSDTTTQITSNNLQEGDTIVLSFSSTSSSSSSRGFGLGGGFGVVTGGGRTVVNP
jgi:HlyD family secretion protein